MAKIWFCYNDLLGRMPEISDIYRLSRLAYAEEVATRIGRKLEPGDSNDGEHSSFVQCPDRDVQPVVQEFIAHGVVPGTIDFEEEDTTVDAAVSLTTFGLDYTLPG